MLSEGGQDRIVLICTSCKQNRLKMQEVDFSSCHSKVSQAGWLRKEIYSPALGKLEVQSQSVGRAMLPLKPPGKNPALPLAASGSCQHFSVFLAGRYITPSLCLDRHVASCLCVLCPLTL